MFTDKSSLNSPLSIFNSVYLYPNSRSLNFNISLFFNYKISVIKVSFPQKAFNSDAWVFGFKPKEGEVMA